MTSRSEYKTENGAAISVVLHQTTDGNTATPINSDNPLSISLNTSASITEKTYIAGEISIADEAQEVIAADSDGYKWFIQANSENTGSIFIRDDGEDPVEGNGGIEIQPGGYAASDDYIATSLNVIGPDSGDGYTAIKTKKISG